MAACCGLDVVSPSLSLCWRLGPRLGASEGWTWNLSQVRPPGKGGGGGGGVR